MTFETIACFERTKINRRAGFGPIKFYYKPRTIRLKSVGILIFKKDLFCSVLFFDRTEQIKSKLTVDRSKWLPKQFQINVSSLSTRKIIVVMAFRFRQRLLASFN